MNAVEDRTSWLALGDDLGDGDQHAVEVAATAGAPARWPWVRERFQVHPDGSVTWQGRPAIGVDGVEVRR